MRQHCRLEDGDIVCYIITQYCTSWPGIMSWLVAPQHESEKELDIRKQELALGIPRQDN